MAPVLLRLDEGLTMVVGLILSLLTLVVPVVLVDGLRVLDPARTALDMTREHGLSAGVASCDRALRKSDPRLSVTATTVCTLALKHCARSRVRFPPDRRGIDNEDRDAREAEEVRPGVP